MSRTTAEWDAKWRWPVGTRVVIRGTTHRGIVTKENSVSVHIRLDDGRELRRVSKTHPHLHREVAS